MPRPPGVPSVDPYYRPNESQRRVEAIVSGDNKAWLTCGNYNSARTTRKPSNNEMDSIEEVISRNVRKEVDFELVVELGRVLLVEFLNTILLACLIVVQIIGIVVLEIEKELEN